MKILNFVLSLILCITIVVIMCACGSDGDNSEGSDSSSSISDEISETFDETKLDNSETTDRVTPDGVGVVFNWND